MNPNIMKCTIIRDFIEQILMKLKGIVRVYLIIDCIIQMKAFNLILSILKYLKRTYCKRLRSFLGFFKFSFPNDILARVFRKKCTHLFTKYSINRLFKFN